MTGDSVVIMSAPNGARRTKTDHPRLPITPAELAETAMAVRAAGACALHLHVRDGEQKHSLDPGLYRESLAAVREAVGDDLFLQVTTEAVGRYSPAEQIASVKSVRPEAVSIAFREIMPDDDGRGMAVDFFQWLHGERIAPQIILYDVEDVSRFRSLNGQGDYPFARPSLLFVLGRYTPGQRSDPSDLDPFIQAIGDDRDRVDWMVCAFGAKEAAIAERAMRLGGHVRIGFENNLNLPDGSRAPGNAALITLASESAVRAGRPLMDGPACRAFYRAGL